MGNCTVKCGLLLVLFISLLHNGYSQTQLEKTTVLKETNVSALKLMAERSALAYKANKEKALKLASKKGWEIRKEFEGGFYELQGVSESGQPIYYITTNADAAESVSTNELYTGGSLGLSLDGTDMTAGEWDGGDVLTTHQEFNNTGSSRVTDKDGVNSTHYHATHVAGTIIAGGVQAAAKGMAYNASLDAYDWNSDEAEMAAAAADGLLISNHSYGYITGWYWNGSSWVWQGDTGISSEEDYHFGFYGSGCQDLDGIAYDAPYYLICKSAGNDRGDGAGQTGHPIDGGADGYDCIGWKGNAKNILTIGAVKDVNGGYSGNPADVEMTSFSSWGPSDDGRIKPDICGNGYNLYSTYDDNNSAYNTISGTSMSSPNVTGSLLLLQEHYNENNGSFMKSATLKALAIHTADEAGPDNGPDYMFGWGLLNSKTAAQVISNENISSFINEESLTNGGTFTLDVTPTGTEPLVVTVVWTDPEGTPVAAQLDPADVMLVNDIDVTVADGNKMLYYPYKLDRLNPSAAATTGNNDVDNVEKIVIENPSTDTYTITVNHEGTLTNGLQDFSLIVTGISNGYAVVTTGDVSNITLNSADVSGEVVSDNGNAVTERGFVYNLNGNPTTSDNKIVVGSGVGVFSTTLNNLSQATTYYVRAYGINSQGTIYGDNKLFTTLCDAYSTFPFIEEFSDQTLPGCWDNVDNEGSGQIWEFVSGGYQLGGNESFNSTTESDGFAVLDSDQYGNGNSQDADLVTPVFDFSSYNEVVLNFEHYFKSYPSSSATLLYSINGGSSWIAIQSWSSTTNNAELFSQDLSSEVAGESNVKFKWNYTGSYGYYWAIDDVEITTNAIATEYTVTFNVTDAATSNAISGAEIIIDGNTLTTNSSGEATVDLIDGNYSYSVNAS
ncbi:MAG: S8 family serine peptidase, partial [Bacteroidota bacterium]|nr:S8 family serine peptidase [Bacteroidota bacterium]